MLITYITAGVVASLTSIRAFKHPHLAYWWKWDRVLIVMALTSIVLIYAATGAGVTALAHQAGWELVKTGSARGLANGASYGIAACIVINLEVSSLGLEVVAPSRFLLKAVLSRLEGTLDQSCARAIPRKVGDLTARQLCRVSWQLFLKYVNPSTLGLATKLADARELRKRHRLAMHPLTDGPEDAPVIEAQEDLRATCIELIITHHESTIEFPPHDVPSEPPSA